MNLGEIFLISAGLCLDLFTVLVCQGALMSKVSRKEMVIFCLIFGAWQIGFLTLGNLISWIPFFDDSIPSIGKIWRLLSALIFFGLGSYFVVKAIRSKPIVECRDDDIKIRQLCLYAFVVSLGSLFAGIGFGFLKTSLLKQVLAMSGVTILSIILGVFVGYRLGSQNKNKAYAVGSILLFIGAFDSLFRFTVFFN